MNAIRAGTSAPPRRRRCLVTSAKDRVSRMARVFPQRAARRPREVTRGGRAGIGVDPLSGFGELPRARQSVGEILRAVTGELTSSVDLYWLPLGAGGHSVRLNGRLFEAVVALRQGRKRYDLYHSALVVRLPEGRFVIEQGPAGRRDSERGVVAEGAVGARWAGRLRLFRYEVRCWRDGVIPDVAEAVDSPQRMSDDEQLARRLVELVPTVPRAVWGRDELRTGEMWNSNSVISWLLESIGLPTRSIAPPEHGRAPGWDAGLVIARRTNTPA